MKVNVLTNSKASLAIIMLLTVSFLAVSAQTPITVSVDVTYGGADKTATATFGFTGTQSQVITPSNANQTNPNAIPEFGPLAGMIIAISTIGIIVSSRLRSLKMQ